jgi:hypothetical protein
MAAIRWLLLRRSGQLSYPAIPAVKQGEII